jgi:hypothetical protein
MYSTWFFFNNIYEYVVDTFVLIWRDNMWSVKNVYSQFQDEDDKLAVLVHLELYFILYYLLGQILNKFGSQEIEESSLENLCV